MQDENTVNKKVALIVGGSGGIGYAVTKRLLLDGMQVCSTYYNNKEKIEMLQNNSAKDDVLAFRCDVLDDFGVREMVADILARFHKVDVVVFTVASTLKYYDILDLEWNDFSNHIEMQAKAILFVVKSLSEQIRLNKKVKFIVISSEVCVGSPPKGLSNYTTAKYAALGLSKTMAVELARYNCTVNMITPGMVNTALLENFPSKLLEMTMHQNPLKRIASPDDVSNVVSFLASDQSDYLNGVNITVNGGGVMF